MSDRRTAGDYMTRDLIVIPAEMDLYRAMNVLAENDVSGAPVVDETGRLAGILTEKDCFRAALEASYHRQQTGTASDFMSRDVRTIDEDTDIVEVIETLRHGPYRRFPVTAQGRLVGILSRRDALRAVIDLW